ncbi:YlbD family protein [Neobacillus sp. CF12]|uniref:YlbD family protein n=1 Tax=Neobacillus sp. CF12 TaxID=3055864 RepID=UPI0025A22FFD|nr:YlbD family protein [Neobacillus sp. CF12]MDM5328067.1 YlbD family protein [Neobacillus sp. CF12]
MQKNLHPSVIKFKEFVKNNPALIKEVRNGNATWQELYEDWYLLGEEDNRWETLGVKTSPSIEINEEKKGDWISTILGTVQKMDPDQIQHYVNNLSQALGAIQGVISQFQRGQPKQVPSKVEHRHPFSFRKD